MMKIRQDTRILRGSTTTRNAGCSRYNGSCRKFQATVEASNFPQRIFQGTTPRAKNRDDFVDVEVVFDGVEDEDELGFGTSASSMGFTQQALESVGVVADQLTEAAMQFVPEGTSFEVVRVAVVGGIVLVILSFVKGVLSLALTLGTVGFGAYVYTRVYGGPGGRSSQDTRSSARARSAQRRTPKKATKGRATKTTAASSAGNILSNLLNSTGNREMDDGLLDVTFKKQSRGSKSKRK